MEISLSWVKCSGSSRKEDWCQLENVNLSEVKATGVYFIWHAGNPGRFIRVGQGDIRERLGAHRNDKEILAYKSYGTLYATWAAVPQSYLDGVERYLFERLSPQVGGRAPDVTPIAVNLPW